MLGTDFTAIFGRIRKENLFQFELYKSIKIDIEKYEES